MKSDRNNIKAILANNLKKYRLKVKLTQEQAAEKAGVTPNFWQRIELKSQKELPSLIVLEKVAHVLQVPSWKLLYTKNKAK